jgi:ribosomal protein L29
MKKKEVKQLRQKSTEELKKMIEERLKKLVEHRLKLRAGKLKNIFELAGKRREIAQIKTIMTEKKLAGEVYPGRVPAAKIKKDKFLKES